MFFEREDEEKKRVFFVLGFVLDTFLQFIVDISIDIIERIRWNYGMKSKYE